MVKKIALGIGVLALAFLVGAGLVYMTKTTRGASQAGSGTKGSGTRGDEGSTSKSLPKNIIPVADGKPLAFTVEAYCGNCFYGMGDPEMHSIVFIAEEQPKVVIPHPNAQLAELEKVTGSCADGSFKVTLTGSGTRYRDRNYVTISSFTTLRVREGSSGKEGSGSKGSGSR